MCMIKIFRFFNKISAFKSAVTLKWRLYVFGNLLDVYILMLSGSKGLTPQFYKGSSILCTISYGLPVVMVTAGADAVSMLGT